MEPDEARGDTPVQLDGTLDKFPLRELIEMIVYSSVTGVLELHTSTTVHQLFFRDGQPYHALAGSQTGADALGAMFEEPAAPFRFVADREAAEVTLWADPWELIERAEEQARRWSAIRARIPSADAVPALCQVPSSNQIQISEATWPVLAAVDGQRTINEIGSHLNWVLLDTCIALLALIDSGLVTLQAPFPSSLARSDAAMPAGAANTSPNASSESPRQPANGFLERLLAEAQAKEQERPDLTDDEAQDRKRVYRYVDDRR
jgi:hypothetical protein